MYILHSNYMQISLAVTVNFRFNSEYTSEHFFRKGFLRGACTVYSAFVKRYNSTRILRGNVKMVECNKGNEIALGCYALNENSSA